MSMLCRVRPELAAFRAYASARRSGFEARIRLDANECPWDRHEDGDDIDAGLNRYPSPQPQDLRARLAKLYDVDPRRLWLGRGSDEAIDLLLRAFCRAGRDNVVALDPTFGMYRIGAQLQGAEYRALALSADDDFAFDADRLLALTDADTKLVIVCSPNNPTGALYHDARIEQLAAQLAGRALLVVDEAYIEFAGVASATALIDRHDNIAVLRTLSKVHALAGARVGALIAREEIADLIGRISAPYPLPSPSVRAALGAVLDEVALARTQKRIATLLIERARVADALAASLLVRKVWPSAGNFLLVRFADARDAFARLLDAGILVRDFSAQSGLTGCLRITVGRPDENDALLDACAAPSPPTASSLGERAGVRGRGSNESQRLAHSESPPPRLALSTGFAGGEGKAAEPNP
jgi:histidinol-phosphate aminotransferase